MPAAARASHLATAADLRAAPPDARVEIIDGVAVEKAAPSFEHGECQGLIITFANTRFRGGDGDRPGWWFAAEVDVELFPHQVFRPDVAGWRRDRHPQRPTGRPITSRPDWVCEILSPSTAHRDMGNKLAVYAAAGVEFYWLVNVEYKVLTALRLGPDGYIVALGTGPVADARVPPFDHEPLDVGAFFGIDAAPTEET